MEASFKFGPSLAFGVALGIFGWQGPSMAMPLEEADLCLKAQEILGGYDAAEVRDRTTVAAFTDLSAFIASKPAIEGEALKLYAYQPTVTQARSAYGQMWCKLKSPEAIDDKGLFAKGESPAKGCEAAAAAALEAARTRLSPAELQRFDESGTRVVFENKNFGTGSGWAPSVPEVNNQGDGRIVVRTTSLISALWLPRIGGMHYCKIFTVEGMGQLMKDLSQRDFDAVPFADPAEPDFEQVAGDDFDVRDIRFGRQQQATLYVSRETAVKGSYIISPGGEVFPISMRGLAKALAAKGYAVYVIHYPKNLAVLEKISGRGNSAHVLAGLLTSQDMSQIEGLPPTLAASYEDEALPVHVLGHSLGGAVLTEAIFGSDNPFDRIVLYGTTSFIKWPGSSDIKAQNLYAILGEADGLSLTRPDSLSDYKNLLGTKTALSERRFKAEGSETYLEVIPGLNHFCIVSDMTAGVPRLKNQDGEGAIPARCIKRLVDVMASRDLL